MAELWEDGANSRTVLGALQPLLERLGDISAAHVENVGEIGLVAGDLGLNVFEDRLTEAWSHCLDDNSASAADAFRVTSAFHRLMERASQQRGANMVLMDVGPNLGAINRAALVAADYVVVPLIADLFSLRGLKNLGPKLREWRGGWSTRQRMGKIPQGLSLPQGRMEPIGYVVLQHAVRDARPVKAYGRWFDRIPATYRTDVLGLPEDVHPSREDPNMLAMLKHYRSLIPLALDARKPVFSLKPADGALGGHVHAVAEAREDFERLARRIAAACQLSDSLAQA